MQTLTVFLRAFQTRDLRKKLLFTLGMIVLFRFGASLPTPGINEKNVQFCAGLVTSSNSASSSVYQLVNLLSGRALLQLSVFALGIMPYITASIILQLLTVVVPKLEALKQEGQSGQAKITQYTRYLTVGLAILQSTAYVELARSGGLFGSSCTEPLINNPNAFTIAVMVITMVSGTTVIMWMGELITDRGVGNGMSVMIFTTVISVIPGELYQIKTQKGIGYLVIAVVVVVAIVAFVVFMEQAQRRIPVQYAKRMIGRRAYGGTSTYIPIKVNQAGVIPVIFASSLLYIPLLAGQIWGNPNHPQGWYTWIQQYLGARTSSLYMLIYFVLILGFTFFYVSVTFNPKEVSDNMKKYGGFIPGIRPGKPTAEYLQYVLSRLTTPGALYLAIVAIFPLIAFAGAGISNQLPFSGVSLLIIVGVGLDTVKQVESQLQQRSYEGFLR